MYNYESDLMYELGKLMNIKKTLTSPRHPSRNGMVERCNLTLIKMIRSFIDGKQNVWDLNLGCLAGVLICCSLKYIHTLPTFHHTQRKGCSYKVTNKYTPVKELVPIHRGDALNEPIDHTLFGPMKKIISPLPDTHRKIEEKSGNKEKKREEKDPECSKTTEEGKHTIEEKEALGTSSSSQMEAGDSSWKLERVVAPSDDDDDIDEGSPSLRLRLAVMVDQFFYLTAPLHGHHPRMLCNKCHRLKRQLITATYTQDPREIRIPSL